MIKTLVMFFALIASLFSATPADTFENETPTFEIICGNNICDTNETCSSCAIDCGMCQEEILKQIKESVVWVKYDYFSEKGPREYEEKSASGSGVIIDQNENYLFILSNRHVLDCRYTGSCNRVWNENMSVRTQDGILHPVERVSFDPQFLDIAYLRVKKLTNKEYTTASFATDTKVGDSVIAAGYPAYKVGGITEYSSRSGTIKGIKELLLHNGRLLHSLESDAFTFYGSSGGGLFNSKGELLGISTWGINLNSPDASESIAIKIDSLVDIDEFIHCKDDEYISLEGKCMKYYGVKHRLLCFYNNPKDKIPAQGRIYYNGDNQGKLDNGCVEITDENIAKENTIDFDRDYNQGIVSYSIEYNYPLTEEFIITWFFN